MRSPQAVLYFLGELARPGRGIAIRPKYDDQPEQERMLFSIRSSGKCARSVVSVRYADGRFGIPDGEGDCHPGRSTQSRSSARLRGGATT